MIAPLTKRRKDDSPYLRPHDIEALLPALAGSPRDVLLERARIRDRRDPDYVPSECLLYFVRASRLDNSDAWFERLYQVLVERVLRAVPRAEAGGNTTSLVNESIRNAVFDRFVEMLATDRRQPDDKLDFFEVRFDLAVKRLRLDAQERAWREDNRSDALNEDSGETEAVAVAATAVDPFETNIFSDPLFRDRVYLAIDDLPPEQSRIMHFVLLGMAGPLERPRGHDDRQGAGLLGPIGSQSPEAGAQDAHRPVQFWGRPMTISSTTTALDDVLDLFQMEEVHDGDVLARYVEAHPQFALQLIDLSRLLATPEADDQEPLSALDKSRIDAAWILHKAAGPELQKGANPLDALVGERGKSLAARFGVPRQVVTCLRERKVDPARTPRPILRTLSDALAIPEAHVIAAMQQPSASASGRSFKAAGKPGVVGQVSFEQVLIDADVSDADRARLLADGE